MANIAGHRTALVQGNPPDKSGLIQGVPLPSIEELTYVSATDFLFVSGENFNLV